MLIFIVFFSGACGRTEHIRPQQREFVEAGSYSVSKIDLLLAIDNSISGGDQQRLLREGVTELVSRLIEPRCSNAEGQLLRAAAQGECPAGFWIEAQPISDIHVGVITSSLGGHGSTLCQSEQPGDGLDDRGELIAPNRGMKSYNDLGFLAWDPWGDRNRPPGENNAARFVGQVNQLLATAGSNGCGFEAQLESWYRFLIDPDPPERVVRVGDELVQQGTNQTLLAQRAAFLRPDSYLVVVMLSDENDCSVRDEGLGWLVGAEAALPRASSVCDQDPNDACCRACDQAPAAGCPANELDTNCGSAPPNPDDSIFLRCWEQKRRFGVDLLYSTERYVRGLREREIEDRHGQLVPNPLYASSPSSTARPRSPGSVDLIGIVGVPWQYAAASGSLEPDADLHYRGTLFSDKDWQAILGDVNAHIAPTDPLMRESVEQRSGAHTVSGVSGRAMPDGAKRLANPINGHERRLWANDDLQFACIFELPTPRDCALVLSDPSCDCDAKAIDEHDPRCQDPGGGYGTTQYYAGARPSLRQLQVLKDARGYVASACPKYAIGDPSDPNHGYNPAFEPILQRAAYEPHGVLCARNRLRPNPDGTLACTALEIRDTSPRGEGCDCSTPGRRAPAPRASDAMRARLKATHACEDPALPGSPRCDQICVCEVIQLDGAEQAACERGADSGDGFCYVDEGPLLAECESGSGARLRYVSNDPQANPIPARDSSVTLWCDEGVRVQPDGG